MGDRPGTVVWNFIKTTYGGVKSEWQSSEKQRGENITNIAHGVRNIAHPTKSPIGSFKGDWGSQGSTTLPGVPDWIKTYLWKNTIFGDIELLAKDPIRYGFRAAGTLIGGILGNLPGAIIGSNAFNYFYDNPNPTFGDDVSRWAGEQWDYFGAPVASDVGSYLNPFGKDDSPNIYRDLGDAYRKYTEPTGTRHTHHDKSEVEPIDTNKVRYDESSRRCYKLNSEGRRVWVSCP